MRRAVAAAVVASLLAGGCYAPRSEPPADPAMAAARISTAHGPVLVRVEVARTVNEREQGLMEREALGPYDGMFFLYDSPRSSDDGFWMYRTRIPLDIAFIDRQGRIVGLRTMEPCPSDDPERCPVYAPEVGYQAALEVNAGFFERHGVVRGDRVDLLEAGD